MTDPNGWPNPTPDMLRSPMFEAIWQAIKTWDVNVPSAYAGYAGATGNHVRAILDAIAPVLAAREAAAAEAMRKTAADCARRLLLPDDCGPDEAHGRFQQAIATCEAIRALPLPAPDALAAREAAAFQAGAEAMREAAVAAIQSFDCPRCGYGPSDVLCASIRALPLPAPDVPARKESKA